MSDKPTYEELEKQVREFEKITIERKQLEEELRESEEKYRGLFHNSNDAIFIHDLDGNIIDVNQRALELFGYTKSELSSVKIPKLRSPRALEKSRWAFETILKKGYVKFETEFINKCGDVIPTEVSSSIFKIGGKKVIQGIVRDIRARKDAEFARQEASNIIEESPVIAFLWRNEDGWPVEFVSGNVERLLGYKGDDFLSGRVFYNKLVHPEDIERVSQEVTDYSSELNQIEFSHAPYRIIAKDGSIRWVKDHTFIRRDHSGAITHFQGIVEDITAERQSAYQLAAEKERLTVTLQSIGDAVITTNRRGHITLMNPIAEALTGWYEAEATGRPLPEVFRIVNERTRQPCVNPVDKVLTTGSIVGLANHTILIAKDGSEFYIANSGAPIRDIGGEISGVVMVFRDVTDQQRIGEEMQKMERLQSLGILAGGIAHDFNNFLTGILGNLSLAKLDIPPGNMLDRTLNEIEKAAIRAKDLTQQLLTFSKGGEPVKQTANIANLMHEATQFALRGTNVCFDLDFEEGLRLAEVDEGQIAQVVHNLMINANQGMPDGGIVFVRGKNVSLSFDNQYTLEPGEYIQLTIRDEGVGIQPDHLKKIFDPYFTTKKHGNGLGLAVAYSIIAKHYGQLIVDSRLGVGTIFTILLPVSDNTYITDIEHYQDLIIGQGRILVMDDEEFIREVTAAMLEKMGYDVMVAEDGDAAVSLYLDAFKTNKTFEAVILDLTIPGGMGGQETMRQLQAVDPNVRAIVSSGYSNDSVMANFADFGFRAAVKKPYQIREISLVLNQVIMG